MYMDELWSPRGKHSHCNLLRKLVPCLISTVPPGPMRIKEKPTRKMKTQLDSMLPYTREGLKNVILTYDC